MRIPAQPSHVVLMRLKHENREMPELPGCQRNMRFVSQKCN
jgi:hypothetical protein